MQIKCEYCGAFIEETDETCCHCGAVNSNFKRSTDGTPKTIDELKAWYSERNLPPKEVTRFFIGEDYKDPKAFGIYEENGEFIVYKNKADGTRAVRYKGKDEAYAVNEIYLKLKSEILNQKAHNINDKKNNGNDQQSSKVSDFISTAIGSLLGLAFLGGIVFTLFTFIIGAVESIKDIPYAGNYYKYNNSVYYCESYVDDDWYLYDSSVQDYIPSSIPSEMYDDIQSYKFSSNEEWYDGVEKFENTSMGQYVESLKDSSDSEYSWDSSDSWDSDSSDWDSDW